MKKTIQNLLAILLMTFISLSLTAQDSKGTTFWTGLLSNQADNNNTLALYLVSDVNTTATVTIPGLSFSSVVNLTGGVLTTVSLPSTAWASSYFTVLDRGIKVVANDPISVYSLNADAATTDASLVLPTDALGLDHYVMSYRTTLGGLPSNMLVVATENNTTVTITSTVTVGGFTAGVPSNVVLDEGEVYSLRSTGADNAADDLTGTRVQSDKPIAVIGGNECTQVPNGFTYCDHIYEQIQPNSTWGTTFITTPLATRLNGDRFRILAQEASTQVSINGALVATLNAGEFYETVITGASEVSATKPILVSQFSHSTQFDGVLSDPFMLNVPPTDQYLASYVVGTVNMIYNPSSQVNYLNLTSPTSATGSVTLNGNPVTGWTAVGSSTFSQVSVQVANGQHAVNSPLPVGLLVYGFSSVESYGYVGGQSFSPVATVSSMSLNLTATTAYQAQQQCFLATVLDQNNNPVVGVTVNYAVSGATTFAGFGTTNAQGEVTLCYTTCLPGTDVFTATIAGLSSSANVTVLPTTFSVAPSTINANVNTQVCATATVIDGNSNPVQNAVVNYTISGANSIGAQSALTNALGQASLCYTPVSSGNDVISVSYGCAIGAPQDVNVTVTSGTTPPATCAASATFRLFGLNKFWSNAGANDPNMFYQGVTQKKKVRAMVSGGIGPYTYSWSNSAGYQLKHQSAAGNEIQLFEPHGPSYMVCEITDVGANCTFKDSVFVDWTDVFYCGNINSTVPQQYWRLKMCLGGVDTCMYWNDAKAALKASTATLGDCTPKAGVNTSIADFTVYPNPTNGIININFTATEAGQASLEVVDMNGRVLQAQEVETQIGLVEAYLDLSDVANGMYFVRLVTAEATSTQRIQLVK